MNVRGMILANIFPSGPECLLVHTYFCNTWMNTITQNQIFVMTVYFESLCVRVSAKLLANDTHNCLLFFQNFFGGPGF